MKKETLKKLSKEDLIDIILSDSQWKRKAFRVVIAIVEEKINDIIDKQEECDLLTLEGLEEYQRLQQQYEKWVKIQEDL